MKNRGFTLIELVIVMLIVGILAAVGSSIISSVVQDLMYAPKNLNMDMLAQDAMDKIIDGDNLAHGLRFSKAVTTIDTVNGNSVTFIDQDGKIVTLTLNTSTHKLNRMVNAVADNTFLYYSAPADIGLFVGRNAKLFLYYKADGTSAILPADVRRVEVNFIARTGTGNFSDWQGKAEISSSVRTSKFQ